MRKFYGNIFDFIIVTDDDYSVSMKISSTDSEGRLLLKAGCRHG